MPLATLVALRATLPLATPIAATMPTLSAMAVLPGPLAFSEDLAGDGQ
ncbi:hypothetical protein PCLA_01f0926 [Pseudomonas citronellolis]|nr:hypothetical protein PCLA_01f0926 [Pseudomonas citronellolis]